MKKHDDQASPALREAIKMLKARKGPATDEDGPRRPAARPHVLPGQLGIADALVPDEAPRGGGA